MRNWERFLSFLVPFNRDWAQNSSVLVYVVSERVMGERPSYTHSFDAGRGLGADGAAGVDAGLYHPWHGRRRLPRRSGSAGVPESFKIEAAIAVGRAGDPATLPEKLREREMPSERKSRDEIVYAGDFRG